MTATTTNTINCQICSAPTVVFDAKQKHCPTCGQLSTEAYKATAQLRKALKLASAVLSVGGSAPATTNDTVRRLAEKVAGLNESSATTWALVAVLMNGESE